MNRFLAIICAFFVTACAWAQPASWESPAGKVDVYPTQKSTADAMADRFVERLRTTGGFDEYKLEIAVCGTDHPTQVFKTNKSWGRVSQSIERGPEVSDAALKIATQFIASRLQAKLPFAKVKIVQQLPEATDKLTAVKVSHATVEAIKRAGPLMISGYQGSLQGVMTQGNLHESFDAKFSTKPWVNDWPSFAENQSNTSWTVGRSSRVCVTQAEAEENACDDAARQIIPLLKPGYAQGLSYDAIRLMIRNQLRTSVAAERFVQRIDKPYGSIWQSAVLVSNVDGSIDILAGNIRNVSVARESRQSVTFGSIALMAIVIFVLYFFSTRLPKAISPGGCDWARC